jgi:myo-inositol-1(or 4)-monophosphatase
MTSFLTTALEAAEAAGDVLRRKYREAREVTSKGLRDIVTDADLAAERAILDVITARFPDHLILSEEGKHDKDLAGSAPTWIIDPLDGTSNYAHRFPYFSVSIGLAQHGEVLVGVVYDCLRREMFLAEKGQGAFRQSAGEAPEPLHVSAETDLAEALIGLGWPRDPAKRRTTMAAAERMSVACRTLRSLGTAALELAEVAAGGLDGFYHLSLFPWDVAAGALLIKEAGGRLSTPTGGPWRLGELGTVATNGLLHPSLLAILPEASGQTPAAN